LLFHGAFVDSDGFLAVFGCAVDVACFFGEDFEEAEVDGLYAIVISDWTCLLRASDGLLTLSSTNNSDIASVLATAAVLSSLCTRSLVGRGEWIGSSASDSLPLLLARRECGDCD
jgi:hypothetical protein